MSEKRKSTSPSAIQVKNRERKSVLAEKLDVLNQLKKGDRTINILCNIRFVLAYVHFAIMVIELQKVLSQ